MSTSDPSKTRSAFAPMKPSNPLPQKTASSIITPPLVKPAGCPSPTSQAAAPSPLPQAASPAPTKPYDVAVTVQLLPELPDNDPVRVRSKLTGDGRRTIQLALGANHLLVSRSLQRADTLVIRFLLCLAISEYLKFWGSQPDGKAIKEAVAKLAAIKPDRLWGISLANRLAASELLRSLDTMPIFGSNPSGQPHELFRLASVQLREFSDLPAWRPRGEPKKEAGNAP